MTPREYVLTMPESALMETVAEMAVALGYLVYHVTDSRKDIAGFPDFVLVPPSTEQAPTSLPEMRRRGALFVELKTTKGRLRPEQRTWLERLERAGSRVFVWRPENLINGDIERVLEGTEPEGNDDDAQ